MNQRFCQLMWIGLLCASLAACATTTDSHRQEARAWGSQATLLPPWKRVTRAANKALRDPQAWAPALGAVVFSATDWDKDVSEWAQRHHPVYGSQRAALQASDDLRDGAKYGAIITALLTPNGDDFSTAATGKLKGMGLQLGAYFATESLTTVFKRGFDRRRPSGVNNRSFPSGHTSAAFAAGTSARRNVAASNFSATTSRVLDVSFVALGVGTSWARVEGGMHYPSDVFAGAALGYFVSAVVNDAFIANRDEQALNVSLHLGRDAGQIGFSWPID